ncbi:MAG: thioredoxin domain-containing protein [Oscillospiraceae bacterium]|nr:thioredoxin domain-containing protein [Oscillospiraceae bacterium]
MADTKRPSRLANETSPYLIQHANNPVDWYPWGKEAFEKARTEDKPVFLSIGYSTCHWCHVMARESFEDKEAAEILNRDFVPVKVDKEERPDIDSVYMNVCVSLTGSGGWPLTAITDHTGNPFFAGTYFPKRSRYGMTGLIEILENANQYWRTERQKLTDSARMITAHINAIAKIETNQSTDYASLIAQGVSYFKTVYDPNYGGFGRAPKFPSPHNLLFLMEKGKELNDSECLDIAEKTLMSMAKGGIFDHIGFGFSRYSTDEKWLVPHFEKMLYDNALLIMAYTKAYEITKNPVYRSVAEKTILYIKREMTNFNNENLGFYSAEDADSDGIEGKFYVFTPQEIKKVLGEKDGSRFCGLYDITESGNFEGRGENIPNQINKDMLDDSLSNLIPALYEYRKARVVLHKDDKILTAWNALMIAAYADSYKVFGDTEYLRAANKAVDFIETNLCENDRIYTSYRDGKRTGNGVLDDYAFYIYALLQLYRTENRPYLLSRARQLTDKVIMEFPDNDNGGFYLTPSDGETLIIRPKETHDGAIPSGNSVMAMNLLDLNLLTGEYGDILDKHIRFMACAATDSPGGHAFFLYTLLKKETARHGAENYICDENGCRHLKT